MQQRRRTRQSKRPIESYDHRDKERLNNPPVGLVTAETDQDAGKKTYAYDPHLDPQLQWAGKAEHTSFDVPTVSLHVHERIDPRTLIEATRRRNGAGAPVQGSLFELPEENPPVRNAIEFYRHSHNWSNRLVAGDSLLVMNSLLEKEGMAGKVQMVYIDPPYGIRYGSNFQPFVNRRDVRDGRDEDLTQEPETIKAFRDTWELGIHSYLSYLRDRLLLARELLTESGSCFVQISDENVHLVRSLMDDVFGRDGFVAEISYRVFGVRAARFLDSITDNIIWYGKNREQTKYRQLFHYETSKSSGFEPVRLYRPGFSEGLHFDFDFGNKTYRPPYNMHWATGQSGLAKLKLADRLIGFNADVRYRRWSSDFPCKVLTTSWQDTWGEQDKSYAVQTASKVIERCMLMATDPGDLVFDPTCGSGTTAYVAEQWGRRWITCDTSRVAVSLAKQRLMTAVYDYYELSHPQEGVGSGFNYKTVPHVTLRSIANNPDIKGGMTQAEIDAAIARHAPQETLFDQPMVDSGKKRVTGPFSVEAVPAPAVAALSASSTIGAVTGSVTLSVTGGADLDADDAEPLPADDTVARSGETLRQADWRDELLKTGIRGKAGQFIRFARLEPLPDYRYLHADGESLPNRDGADSIREGPAQTSQRIVVSFGPEHAPLEQRQVNRALQEAQTLVPAPKVIVFAAFQFDPEASKDIDETNWPGVTLLKAQMNADLLTEDLKRQRASNESFWLIGQPDVQVNAIADGDDKGKYQVGVLGFDYYNTKSGDVESGGQDKIAMWMMDPDYDGRSLFPRQVFFPMSGANDGWARLARNLKAEIDESLIESYRGTISLPFEPGENRRIAVKIIDDRGIESLKVIVLDSAGTKPQLPNVHERRLEDRIQDLFTDVPQEEWDRLPDDLIENLDHYLYGTEKR